jgi:hypothetical protein
MNNKLNSTSNQYKLQISYDVCLQLRYTPSMSNIYHHIHTPPALEAADMPPQLETLAQRLVQSGKFRIDAGFDTLNFARFSLPYEGINHMLSSRELTDPALLPRTRNLIATHLRKKHRDAKSLDKAISVEIKRLRDELDKYVKIDPRIEMKLARIIVQCAHPAVIQLLLWEEAEVLVSFAYSIGDMLEMSAWKSAGSNSGMQSSDGRAANIYVSAGGDPFGETEKDRTYGDGLPALARMMIIAGQEIGHFSDMIRDRRGRYISRHAADSSGRRAKENVRIARIRDINNVRITEITLQKINLLSLIEQERAIIFFRKNKRRGFIVLRSWIKWRRARKKFMQECKNAKLEFVTQLAPTPYIATRLHLVLQDMKANLSPDADVYKRSDPEEEEAIACIEALARVPQQRIKWGKAATKALMPNLYHIYYKQVIPACIQSYETLSGARAIMQTPRPQHPWWKLAWRKIGTHLPHTLRNH